MAVCLLCGPLYSEQSPDPSGHAGLAHQHRQAGQVSASHLALCVSPAHLLLPTLVGPLVPEGPVNVSSVEGPRPHAGPGTKPVLLATLLQMCLLYLPNVYLSRWTRSCIGNQGLSCPHCAPSTLPSTCAW